MRGKPTTASEIVGKRNLTRHENDEMIDVIDVRDRNDELRFAHLLEIQLRLKEILVFTSLLHRLTNRPATITENILGFLFTQRRKNERRRFSVQTRTFLLSRRKPRRYTFNFEISTTEKKTTGEDELNSN